MAKTSCGRRQLTSETFPMAGLNSTAVAFLSKWIGNTERSIVLKKKFENYVTFRESDRYRNLFPECAFKVLVFTTTEERIESLQQITTSDDIWFCTMEEFLREKLTHAHWFALRGFYALSAVSKKEV